MVVSSLDNRQTDSLGFDELRLPLQEYFSTVVYQFVRYLNVDKRMPSELMKTGCRYKSSSYCFACLFAGDIVNTQKRIKSGGGILQQTYAMVCYGKLLGRQFALAI